MSILPNGRAECSVCNQEKITWQCKGCADDFCYKHLQEHRQLFIEQLHDVETDRDQFREIFIQQKNNLPNHKIMQQIMKWENDAIRRIKQTAEDCRQIFMDEAIQGFNDLEVKLNKLNKGIIETREENEFNEIVLEQLKLKLTKLIEELALLPNITIQQDASPYVSKIFMVSASGNEIVLAGQARTPNSANLNSKYIQNGITVAGGNGSGQKLNQLARPEGIFVDDDLTMYIADSINNRILEWKHGKESGQVIAGGNGKGNRNDQLDGPISVVVDRRGNSLIVSDWGNRRIMQWSRQNNSSGKVLISNIKCCSLAIDNNGDLYVADWKKSEVKRWKIGDKDGVIVAGGNGQGDNLNQLNGPNYIFVDNDNTVYVSNYYNHRVVKWLKGAKEGVIVAGQKGQGDGLSQLFHPHGITVDQSGQVYVADCDNHRVIRSGRGDASGVVVIGGKGQGEQSFQLNTPIGLTLDRQGHLYVVDSENHRIQKYQLI